MWGGGLTIFRLPPGFEAVGSERGNDVLDTVSIGLVGLFHVAPGGVTNKALLLLLRMAWGRGRGERGETTRERETEG